VSALILGIETSCDDTCAAVVTGTGAILSNVVSSQTEHDRFGGVVPEIAARRHLELSTHVVDQALLEAGARLDDLSAVAVTAGPGLVGALLVGLAGAKAIAAARGLPLYAVDHLQGHVCANFAAPQPFEPPFVCLVASGGHTFLARVQERRGFEVLGSTLDDAAGEAFDKGARMLGLPFPGGPHLQRAAHGGDPSAFGFPRALGVPGLDFSFAGLKTSLLYTIRDLGERETARRTADLAASFQEAIVDALARRAERALDQTGIERLAVGGGVAANAPLRERLASLGAEIHVPPPELCTDNAAMIALAALDGEPLGTQAALSLDAYATGERGL
jgi:N6-L-threonylcarbamoyladenine synthase